ncbi:MAG: AarF/ABC1/UbiB kinase family protein, partial [Deltaproteobacteria bacterium]|nr:AarF/ABC1/UbiB kinase family protein [Deltaproteobacteria bacterium]
MRISRLYIAYKGIRRLRTIISALVRHGFYPLMETTGLVRFLSITYRLAGKKISRMKEELPFAVRTRLVFEELGPTFIKFGQILSTRPDIVPEEFIAELLKLQDKVPPFPFIDAKAILESELKKPIAQLFLKIDETPVAAASIAQVHRALTASGEKVAVKIQRPLIRETIETDISILRYLARTAHRYIPESRCYDPLGMVDEFSRNIIKELDFTLEASHTETFRKNFANDPRVKVPRVVWEATTKKVLTMEEVHGIKVDNIAELKKQGIDTQRTAHLIADTFFKQVFDFNLFHGDLHSGNIFVIDENTIALVDFGIVGFVDLQMKRDLTDILIGLTKTDFEALSRVYLRMGILPEDIDETDFSREHHEMIQHYFGRPFGHVKIGELLLDYIKLASRYEIRLKKDFLLFDKCLMELEGLMKLLYPDANILGEAGPYAERLIKERLSPVALAKDGIQTAGEYSELIRELPRQTEQIIKKILSDRFTIEVSHRGIEEFMGEIDRSSNRVTFGLI